MRITLLVRILTALSFLLAALPTQAVQAAPVAVPESADLLQFTSGGHALGFSNKGMYAVTGSHALHVDFAGANLVQPQADSPVNTDGNPDRTQGGAAPLSRVAYTNLWDGITLIYTAGDGNIYTTTYLLASGADPDAIRLRYNAPLTLNTDGTLSIAFETGLLAESAPVAWQEIQGRKNPVDVAFRVNGQEVGFALGSYDPGYPLMIDPSLVWNTFMGESGADYGQGIAVDGDGNVYVTGLSTVTWEYPVRAFAGFYDAYVAKLNPDGYLIWNTFLGSSGYDWGYGIAVDADGNVYVTGVSNATWGSPLRVFEGNNDAFVAKLDANGALAWNTFLGGWFFDFGYGIAVDGSGNVYVTGSSGATWGSPIQPIGGNYDGFAAKLDTDGALTWNTFLGGELHDGTMAIAVDGGGNVYVAGSTQSGWGTPVRAYSGGEDAFAAKLDSSGGRTWLTFLGSSGTDYGRGIAVDGSGNVYIAGGSDATWGEPVGAHGTGYDAFAAKVDSSGALTWNTFLGGDWFDESYGIALDDNGNIDIIGRSQTGWGSPVRAYTGDFDAFAVELDSTGAPLWNTFLGGSGADQGLGIAVGGDGKVYVAGVSPDVWGSPMHAFTGSLDAFAVRLETDGALTWNAFLGGNSREIGYGIAADADGNVYLVGTSSNAWGSPVRAYSAGNDVFVAKLDPAGALTWHTFLGGDAFDTGRGIAVDGDGNVYVVGSSQATWGSPVRAYAGGEDPFAAKLDSSGALIWNTFLGCSGYDTGFAIAADGDGNVYVAGGNMCTWGDPIRPFAGSYDAFAAKLDSTGAVTWNTFLGGTGSDGGYGIAVDGSGNAYVTGQSEAAWGSPVRPYIGSYDAFIAKLDSSGALAWNTFLGGSGYDGGLGIALNGSGNLYVAGTSDSSWFFPVRAYSGGYDAFAAKLNSSTGALSWNTFLGGSGTDYGRGIAVDGSGNLYVAGESGATWGNPLRGYSGGTDAFTARLTPSGGMTANTFLGWAGSDSGHGIAAAGNGGVFVAGESYGAWGSPVRAYSASLVHAFAAKLDLDPPGVVSSLRANPDPTTASSVDFTVTFSEAVTGVDAGDFTLSTTGISGASVTGVSGTDDVRTVTVITGTGSGSLRLDIADDDSIVDAAENPLGGPGAGNGNYTGGESYSVERTEFNPNFSVKVNLDLIEAWEWQEGDVLTLEIDDPATPENPDYTGEQTVGPASWDPDRLYASFALYGVLDIQPGFFLSLSNGTTTKTHTVTNLEITDFDIENDVVTGTAEPDSQVYVTVCDPSSCSSEYRHIQADSVGVWTADFANPGIEEEEQITFDIVPGTNVEAFQSDADSDSTHFVQPVPNPRFEVFPRSDSIQAVDWPLGVELTLTIDNPATPEPADYTALQTVVADPGAPGRTIASFDLGGLFDIQAGYLVTVSGGATTKMHTVASLAFTDFDMENDVVTGMADPDAQVEIRACGDFSCPAYRRIPVDGAGIWTADFAHPGAGENEQDLYDLVLYTYISAWQTDEDGDSTQISGNASDPSLQVWQWDTVIGTGWPLGNLVTLTVEDPDTPKSPDYTGTATAFSMSGWPGGTGVEFFFLGTLELEPGFVFTMSDGILTRVHTLRDLHITWVDVDADTVSGTLNPGMSAWVSIDGSEGGRQATADVNGEWLVDFSVPGVGGSEQTIFDIQPDSRGNATSWDEAGGHTTDVWRVLNPYIEASPSGHWIRAYEWPYRTELTLTIDDPGTPEPVDYTTTASMARNPENPGDPYDGLAEFAWPESLGLQAGFEITVSGGATEKTLTVMPLDVIIDLLTDTVSGTAEPGRDVQVCANTQDDCIHRRVTADGAGDWMVDFGVPGIPPDDVETLNLQGGATGWAVEYEADNDRIWLDWDAGYGSEANPYIKASADEDWVHARDWPAGSEITLTINGETIDTATMAQSPWNPADPNDTDAFFDLDGILDLANGDLVNITDGTTSVDYSVVDLTRVRWFVGLLTGSEPGQIVTEQEVADQFNVAHSGIELILEVHDSDSAQSDLQAEIDAGNAPDIIGIANIPVSAAFQNQWLDLDPWIVATDFDMGQFNPALKEIYAMEEGQLGLPFSVFPSAIFYNPDLFDVAGLSYPPDEYGESYILDSVPVTWNWDTVAEVGKRLTLDSSGRNATDVDFDPNDIVQYGYTWQYENHPNYYGSFWAGGTMFGGGTPGSYTAQLPDAWRAAWEWTYEGIWGPQPWMASLDIERSSEFNYGNPFNSGRFAMTDQPIWYTCCMGDLAEFQLAAMPEYGGEVGGRIDANTFHIWKDTPHPAEAFEALTYLLTTGAEMLLVGTDEMPSAYDSFPALTAAQPAWIASSQARFPFVSQASWDIIIDGLNYPDIPSADGYMPYYSEAWDRGNVFNELLRNNGNLNLDNEIACYLAELTSIFNNRPSYGCPFFDVRANDDLVTAWQWPAGDVLTLEIDDPATELNPDFLGTYTVEQAYWDPGLTFARIELGGEFDIQPGFLVTVSNGTTTKTHTVTNMAVNEIDPDLDIVTGIAEAGSQVNVWICEGPASCPASRRVTADGTGHWTADFGHPGGGDDEQTLYDILPDTGVDSGQTDGDGDSTNYGMNGSEPLGCYTLTLANDPVDGGSVLVDQATNCITELYEPGYIKWHIVTLTASANEHYAFSGWSGDAVGTENPLFITIGGNTTVTANYTQDEYILTLNTTGNGGIAASIPAPYHWGDVVDLTPEAIQGWSFSEWSGACTGSGTCSVTMDDDKTVGATFTEDEYTLTVNITGNGSVNRSDPTPYHWGDVVDLTPDADDGWSFSAWSGACAGSGACEVTMNGNQTVGATFTEAPPACFVLTVTDDPSAGGSVLTEPSTDCVTELHEGGYTEGTEVTLTAGANEHYAFSEWSGDAAGSDNPVTVTMDGNKTVTANYTQDEYTLTVDITGNGEVTPSISAPYHWGDVVDLTPDADDGWSFSAWSGACAGSGACEVTMNGNQTVGATFTEDEYTLTVDITGNGEVTPSISAPYHWGDVVDLTPDADDGWSFSAWSGVCAGSGACEVTMNGNQTVGATFTETGPACYALTLSHVGSGSDPVATPGNSTGCPAGEYLEGEDISLLASPAGGWIVDSWIGTDNNASTSTSNSVTMPAGIHTVIVNYEAIPAPGAFAKLGPASGLYGSPSGVTLTWEASSGATGYEYCYDTSNNGVCNNVWTDAGTDTSAEISGLSLSSTYYWQVRASNVNPEATYANGGTGTGTWWSLRTGVFADVPVAGKEWMRNWIEGFYSAGITTGCGIGPLGREYCPEREVTRAEMAVFLLRAKHGAGYVPPAATGVFGDVPFAGKEWMQPWIEQFYREGITTGCGAGPIYCPERNVTRAEMAVFVLRAKHGASYIPPAATGVFLDVPVTGKEWMQPWIEQFYREGITTGCGAGPLYCPERNVTRAEMAVFLGRAYSIPLAP